ncbi:MAG: hypothetical protein GY942_14820 [Aestuariibacter sp.]|nr:hypothetical protein [Aestuariibacter sp.]
MEAVKQSKRRILDLAHFSVVLLLCGLTLNHPLAATSLFNPEREQTDQDQPSASNGSPLHGLRLDGILTLGDNRRVLISGPEGETYRFNWRGIIKKPMAFEGKSADRLAGYMLSSVDARSVWLQLPSGIGCKPNPEKGVAACQEGRAKLAMVRAIAPPPVSPSAENTKENGVQRLQRISPALARRLQHRRSAALPARENGIQKGARPAYTRRLQQQKLPELTKSRTSNQNVAIRTQTQTQNQSAESNRSVVLDPDRVRMGEEQQRLIDSAPPDWFGVQ